MEERAEECAKVFSEMWGLNATSYTLIKNKVLGHLRAQREEALNEVMEITFKVARCCESRTPEGAVVAAIQRAVETMLKTQTGGGDGDNA